MIEKGNIRPTSKCVNRALKHCIIMSRQVVVRKRKHLVRVGPFLIRLFIYKVTWVAHDADSQASLAGSFLKSKRGNPSKGLVDLHEANVERFLAFGLDPALDCDNLFNRSELSVLVFHRL